MSVLNRVDLPYKQAPSLYTLENLIREVNSGEAQAGIETPTGTKWVPARSLGYFSIRSRLRIAWKVFKGEADAFTWPLGQ